jgi:hypothetical protein
LRLQNAEDTVACINVSVLKPALAGFNLILTSSWDILDYATGRTVIELEFNSWFD